jgi:hypothetical protein
MPFNAASVANQTFSCKGPLVLPVQLDFSVLNTQNVDLTFEIDQNIIDFISTVYVDLRGKLTDLVITPNLVPQNIFAKQNTIGYYPVMVGDRPVFKVTASALIVAPVTLIFSNVPYFPFIQPA